MILKMTSMFIKGLSFAGLIILLGLFNCESQEPTNANRGVTKTVLPTKVKKAKSLKNIDISYLEDLKRELKIGDKMVKRIQRVNRLYQSKLVALKKNGKNNARNRKLLNTEKATEIKKILGSQRYTQYLAINKKWDNLNK